MNKTIKELNKDIYEYIIQVDAETTITPDNIEEEVMEMILDLVEDVVEENEAIKIISIANDGWDLDIALINIFTDETYYKILEEIKNDILSDYILAE